MSGITSVTSVSPVRPTSTPSDQAGILDPLLIGSNIRMAQPVAKYAWDTLVHHAPVPPAPPASMLLKSGLGGEVGAVTSGFGKFAENFKTFFKSSLKANFLVSAVVAGVSNVIELLQGKTTATKAAATFAADTLAYTGIGATCSGLGAALGTLIPIPFVGTALGLAVGWGLGSLYESLVRPHVASMVN